MKVIRRMLSIETGSEGPKHDPYSYRKHIVYINDMIVTYHIGLAVWLEFVEGATHKRIDANELYGPKMSDLDIAFEDLTGIEIGKFEKYYYMLHGEKTKCPKCGHRKFEWHGGFVGESLQACAKCKAIVYCEQVTDSMIA